MEQLLSRGQRGCLYRVTGPEGPALLKELLYPPGLRAEEQQERAQRLQLAVQDWQQLDHPQAIRVLDYLQAPGKIFLVLPELEGSPLSIQQKLRKEPPDPRWAVLWADQLASLVQALMARDHPLASEILRLDRVISDAQGRLTVFHAGWSELLWRTSQASSWPELLQDYGKLLVEMATGDATHPSHAKDLPAGLIWVVGRCLSDLPGRGYADWTEVRKGLRNLTVQGDERALGKLPPLVGFRLPVLADLPRTPRFLKALLAGLAMLLLCGIYWLIFGPSPPPRRPGLAVAIGARVYCVAPDRKCRQAWKFERPVQALAASPTGDRLVVGLKDEPALQVVQVDTGEVRKLSLPSPPEALFTTSQLAALLKGGRVLRFQFLQEEEAPFSSLQVGMGCTDLKPLGPTQLVTVRPQYGLTIYESRSGKRLAEWAHSGYRGLMVQSGRVVTASDEGKLVLLNPLLRPLASHPLPLRSGPTWLHGGEAQHGFWSLQTDSQQKSSAGYWNLQNLQLKHKLSLPAAPQLATTDYLGCLWWVDAKNRLYRLTPDPLSLEEWGELPGKVQAMTYLQPPPPRSLEVPPPGMLGPNGKGTP